MTKKLFISVEGIDGAGKDTQLYRLIEALKSKKLPFGDKYSTIWLTREPTKLTEPGRTISRLLKEKEVSGEETSRYFTSDRKEHSRIIEQMLEHSFVLISRYDLSTLAYQMTQGQDFEKLYEMHEYGSENGTLIPDLTLVFDLPVEVALQRIGSRNEGQEFFEKEEFMTKLYDNIHFCVEQLKGRGRKVIVVDANQTRDEVTAEMIKKINEEF